MRTQDSPSRPQVSRSVPDAVRARDAGVRLARRMHGWVVAVAVGAAGGLAALTAHAYHAQAAATQAAAARARAAQAEVRAAAPAPQSSAAASAAAVPQAPAAAPVPAAPADVAPVVSGGS